MRRSRLKMTKPIGLSVAFFLFSSTVFLQAQQTENNVNDTATQSKKIEEVVIVAYGKQKKENLTSAVSTISSKTLEGRPSPTVTNMIQGAAPGLVVTRSSGRVGAQGLKIQVRGATSANGHVNPLIVIDGVTSSIGTFNSLNPLDIENITVLKDAAAAAIYGAQSAGGVILVTTKHGKKGKSRVSFYSTTSIQMPQNLPDRLSLIDEMNYVNLARKNAGLGPEYSEKDLYYAREGIEFVLNPATNLWKTYNQKDLIDMVMKDAYLMTQNNVQISGGSEKVQYLASIGNMQQNGAFKVGEDRFTRWNARLNLNATVNKYLKLSLNSAYTAQSFNLPQDGGWGLEGGGNGILRQFYSSRMRFPIFNPDGSYYISGTSSAFGYALLKDGGFNRDRRENISNNITATLANFAKGLKVRFIYGRENEYRTTKNFRRTVDYYAGPEANSLKQLNNPNRYSVSKYKYLRENFQTIADYTFRLGRGHNFHLMGGFQMQKYDYYSLNASTKNLFVNENPSLNFTSDPANKSHSESSSADIMQSFFGRFNYNYRDKYLFQATIRADESSRLTQGDRVKIFPSFSIGWNIAKEKWFDGIDHILNELKPRASWGKVGSNLGIGYYDYIAQLHTGSSLLLGDNRETYIYQNALPATSLGWETIETRNIGLDFALLDGKLQGSFDYYNKYNNNMLVPISLPETVGLSVPKQNAGKLKTWGWELSLSYRDQIGSDFNYSVTFNLADNQNKLIRYDGDQNIVYSGVNGLVEGYALNSIWAYKADGYFQTEEQLQNAPSYAKLLNSAGVPGLGDIRYVDVNGDGEISAGKNTLEDHGDLVYIGDTNPRYQFGINVYMNYKNIDLSFFIQGVAKRRFKPSNELIQPQLYPWYQPLSFQTDYWTPDNRDAAFPRPYLSGKHNFVNSDKWFINGAYARLKNIQLGYSLSPRALKNLPITKLRVYISGEDLLTLSDLGVFRGSLDPEQPQGVVAGYPFAKTVSIGVNVNF